MAIGTTLRLLGAPRGNTPAAANTARRLCRGFSFFVKPPSAVSPASPAGRSWGTVPLCRRSWLMFYGSNRGFSAHAEFPEGLERDMEDTINIPVGGENLYRRVGGPGYPMLFDVKYDRPTWQPLWEDEHEIIPRDGYGVPAHIPPEVSTRIKHVFHLPPQFYPFLKKLGDDTPALQPYMEKLINGQLTFEDYEDMFYKFAKPAKIYRRQLPAPYRTPEEISREEEVEWEGSWLSYRQRVLSDYQSSMYLREYLFGAILGVFFGYLWLDQHRQYRIDMKLFYLEAPEHKVNWVKPRGDLV